MDRARTVLLVFVAALAVACGGPGGASPSGASSPAATLPAASEPATSAPTAAISPSPAAAPTPLAESTVVVTCDGPAASLSGPAVRALPDGVHLEAVRADGSPTEADIWVEDADSATSEPEWMSTPEGATVQGVTQLVLAPGAYLLTCPETDPADGTGAELLVTDPDGLWKPGSIACEGGSGVTGGGGGERPVSPGDAIAHLRSVVLNFRPDDILEPAGYPDAPSGWIRLVRDGRLAAAWFVTGTGSSAGISSMEHCPGADIVYRESGED